MPKQFYILVLVLLLYWCPWQPFSSDSKESWLLSVITMQFSFVMACNRIVKESWIKAIIAIELIAMIINVTFFVGADIIRSFHAQLMFSGFIMELLIITISLRGEIVGRQSCYNIRMAGNDLRYFRDSSLPADCSQEVSK